ncbi:MAG: low molecular weight phosphotyrosine protein phosphatase [Alphaproteobacteria bacterium]|nr:low molecular weight phosphotyrosine protein phosphatase [Alphaproteobacteria bacterium]
MHAVSGDSRGSVLYVCTGNICRSPTAHAILRDLFQKRGKSFDLNIDSAGTHGYHVGSPPDERSCRMAERAGINMRDLRARQFSRADFQRFNVILAMDEGHLDYIQRLASQDTAFKSKSVEIALFLDYAGLGAKDVPDPYYGGEEGFKEVYQLIHAGCERIYDRLTAISEEKHPDFL